MPLYEFVCDQCQCKFELLRSFSRSDEPVACPRCKAPEARRLLSRFSAISKGGDGSSSSAVGGGCGSCQASSCAGCGH